MMQELAQKIIDVSRGVLNDVHTAIPGKITSFEPGSCTAAVKPLGAFHTTDGRTLNYPSVIGVPVIFPQGNNQKAVISFPVKPGDGCLLIVCESDIQSWVSDGKEADSDMKFDLTNSICIPGMFNKGCEAVQKAYDENAIVIQNEEDMIITIKKDEALLEYKENKIKVTEDEILAECKGKNIKVSESGVEIQGDLLVHGAITQG